MRSRNIKPGFYQNDELAACSLMARFIFPGLWMLADREGRLEDRPLRIKAALLPYDNANTDELLDELAEHAFIVRYTIGDSRFIQIAKFQKHQNPHCKEAASIIPGPEETGEHCTSTVQEQDKNRTRPADSLLLIPDSLIPDSSCSEPAKPGSEPEPAPFLIFPTKGTGAKTWDLMPAKLAEYRESFPAVDVEAECRAARQWCIDNPARQKTPDGMPRFLNSWLKKEQNSGRPNSKQAAPRAVPPPRPLPKD